MVCVQSLSSLFMAHAVYDCLTTDKMYTDPTFNQEEPVNEFKETATDQGG